MSDEGPSYQRQSVSWNGPSKTLFLADADRDKIKQAADSDGRPHKTNTEPIAFDAPAGVRVEAVAWADASDDTETVIAVVR